MAFFTARRPSLTASLICVRVCLLGPFTSRVTERGFPHFSMNVYFSSPCKQEWGQWTAPPQQRKINKIHNRYCEHRAKKRQSTQINTHQCVFINQPSMSQALKCEVINWVHGNATASEGEPVRGTIHCMYNSSLLFMVEKHQAAAPKLEQV